MQIIEKRKTVQNRFFAVDYWFVGHSHGSGGFSFDCDENGVIVEAGLPPAALENLRKCRSGVVDGRAVTWKVVSWVSRYTEPARGRCPCGRVVVLSDPMDNGCDCGRWFNGSGQEVICPVSQCDRDGTPYSDFDP